MLKKKMFGLCGQTSVIVVVVFSMLCSVLFAGCGKSGRDLAAIKKSGEIVMYTNAEYPPYEYVGEKSQPQGIDIDIANEIAADIGCKLKIINASFDGFSLALQNGQADMGVSAISITPERQETLDFSAPYIVTIQYILRLQTNDSINTIEDFAGKKVGVQLGTTGDFLIENQIADGVLKGTGAKDVQYKTLQEAILALKKGDLDAIVSDEGPLRNLAAENPDTVCFKASLATGELDEEFYGVAVKKGNTDLLNAINQTLVRLISSGFIEERGAYHKEQSVRGN
ncbi:MAG: basic amino acid ABC transporter substrate-binding protein [Termitinemataceae bacterium]|nr:MAG: basic amino acid ABC transporter substrate-binding protein [Termitinemataceae bacterium]